MLTETAYNERKWGPFPALRKILEEKKIKDPNLEYYGLTSADDNIFDQTNRLIKMAILVEQNEENILNYARPGLCEEFFADLDHLEENMQSLHRFIDEKTEIIKDLKDQLVSH